MKNSQDPCAMSSPSKYSETYIRLSASRIIFLAEEITKQNSAELSALLLYYDNKSNEEPIVIYLDSNGGDASGLSNIYDVMQMIKAPVKTICIGRAYSAAAVLLSAGAKGERYIFRHAKVMIHGIQCNFPILGQDQTTSKNYYDFLNANNDSIMKMLVKHTGHPLNKIREDCKRDLFFDAKQAVKYGIVDHIIP